MDRIRVSDSGPFLGLGTIVVAPRTHTVAIMTATPKKTVSTTTSKRDPNTPPPALVLVLLFIFLVCIVGFIFAMQGPGRASYASWSAHQRSVPCALQSNTVQRDLVVFEANGSRANAIALASAARRGADTCGGEGFSTWNPAGPAGSLTANTDLFEWSNSQYRVLKDVARIATAANPVGAIVLYNMDVRSVNAQVRNADRDAAKLARQVHAPFHGVGLVTWKRITN
jgi:hypothetical protein